MARKPRKLTKAERGRLIMQGAWPEDILDDPYFKAIDEEDRRKEGPPDFSNVKGSFNSAPEPGFLQRLDEMGQRGINQSRAEVSNLVDNSFLGGGERSAGAGLFTASDNPLAALLGQAQQANQMGTLGAFDLQNRIERGQVDPENNNPFRDVGANLYNEGQARVTAGEKFAKGESSLPEWLSVGLNDVAASPSSLASLPGGAFAAIPAADVFAQEYTSARLAGLDRNTAGGRAGLMAGIEGGISSIPTFGALEKFGYKAFGKDLLRSNLAKLAGRAAATGVGEAAEEAVTTVGQLGVDKAIAAITDDKKTRTFSEQNTVDFFNQVRRAGVAGFLGGTGLGGPAHAFEVMSEAGKLASDAQLGNQATREFLKGKNAAITEAKTRLEQVAQEKKAAEKQKEIEMEAGFQTLERQGLARFMQEEVGAIPPEQQGPMQAAFQNVQTKPVTPADVLRQQGEQPLPAPVQEQPTPAPVVPAPTTPAVDTTGPTLSEDEDIDVSKLKDVDTLKQELGMASAPANTNNFRTEDTGVTADQAIKTLQDNVGGAPAKKLLKLIGDQNLVVVNDHSELPKDVHFPEHGAAYYDGERTYLVANRISKENMMGEMLTLAAHETKHAADISGNKSIRNTLGSFIGKSANDQIIRKVEALAKSGDPQAQHVMQMANEPGSNYELELPAYVINWQRQNRDRSGPLSRVANNVVSAVRTRYKALKGDADINLNDVAYMSDRLLEEAANNGEAMKGNTGTGALPMIMGKSAPQFEKFKRAGLTYKSIDGNEKMVMTDEGASLNEDRSRGDDSWRSRLAKKEPVELADLLDHDILFTQYPQTSGINLQVDDRKEAGTAYWDQNTQTIGISREDIKPENQSRLLDILMHELQHAVQDIEGHGRGGSPAMFLTNKDAKLYQSYDKEMDRLNAFQEQLGTRAKLRRLNDGDFDEKTSKLLDPIFDQYLTNKLTRLEFMGMVSDVVANSPSASAKAKTVAKASLLNNQSVRSLAEDINALNESLDLKYEKLLGESEARYTAENRGMSQEELDVNPEARNAKTGLDYPTSELLVHQEDPENQRWWVNDAEGNRVIENKPGSNRAENVVTGFGDRRADQLAKEEERDNATAKRSADIARMEELMDDARMSGDVVDRMRPLADKLNKLLESGFLWSPAKSEHLITNQMNDAISQYDDVLGGFENVDNDPAQLAEYPDAFGLLANFNRKVQNLQIQGVLHDAIEMLQEAQDRYNSLKPQSKYDRENKKRYEEALGPKAGNNVTPISGNPRTGAPSGVEASASGRFTMPENRVTRGLHKFITVAGGQLKTFGNLGRDLGVMKENADGEAALHSHRAMNYFTWLNRGVDRMARAGVASGKYKNKAEGVKAIKDMINDQMDKIAKLPDATRREAALAAFVRNNPELDGLRESVQEVNQLSRTILKQMIQTHPNPTPAQLKLMNTIMDMSFRYATQMYAAFQGPAGRVHSQRLVDEHTKAQRILDKGGNLPANLKESLTTFRNAMKYLIDHDLTIPSKTNLDSASTDKLAMLYDTWIGDATQVRKVTKASGLKGGLTVAQSDQLVRDTMIAALEAKRPGIAQTDYEGKAKDLINGMLGLTEGTGPIANYYRGFKQDRGILEQRTGLPDEIKKLFGEITDPATRLAVTIAKQGELVARTRMLLNMRDNGTGKWVIPGHKAGLPGNEKFSATLEGENYGPLNGYRTTPETASAIGDSLEMFSTLSDALAQSAQNSTAALMAAARTGVGGLKKLAAWQKISSVVFDFYNMGTNFMGSLIPGIANGVMNPKSYWDGAKTGMDVVIDSVYTKSGHLHPRMEDAIKYGILDSARVQEIRKTPQKYVKELISVSPKAVSVAGKAIGKVGTGTIETFAMSDAWIKIATFEDRVKNLKAFYKAEGENKTDEEIKQEAADTIKDTNITYGRTPPIIRNLESIGLTTFMPYFVSVPRAITMNYVVGVKDMIRATNAKTPKGRALMTMNGLRRITGASVATYGSVLMMKAVAGMVNGNDKDEVDEMKKLMYSDARFSDELYLGKNGEGNPMFARFSRIDPFGPTTDFLRIALDDTIPDDQKRKHMVEMFKDLVITNRFLASAAKVGLDLMTDEDLKNKDTKLEKIGGATAERFKDLLYQAGGNGEGAIDYSDVESVMQLLDSFTPGFADMFDPKNKGVSDPKGAEEKLLSDLIMYSGGRLDVADPGLGSYRAGKEVALARDTGKARLAKALSTGRSPEEMRDIFLSSAAQEHSGMREVAQVYEGMTKGLGLTPRQASKYLKDDANLTESDIANIRNGKVNQELEEWLNNGTRLLSKDALKKRQGQDLTKAEEEELKKKRREFLDQMKALGYKVRENNK